MYASGHNRNLSSSGITARLRDRVAAQSLAIQQENSLRVISNNQTTNYDSARISESRAGSITTYTPILGIGYVVETGGVANYIQSPSPPAEPIIIPPLTVPGAPLSVTAINIGGQMIVSFIPSPISGGTEVLGYTVTASPGGLTQAGSPGGFIFNGLTGGQTYIFTVTAYNAIGNSASSPSSTPTLYITYPSVPQTVSANTTDLSTGEIQITWVAPAQDGGIPILSYTVYIATTNTDLGDAPITVVFPATSAIFTVASPVGLTETYAFYIVATNALGNSPNSASSNTTMPHP